MNPLLSGRDLKLNFGQTEALRGANIDIYAGKTLAIMGPSGSGKSTLLHVLAGVLVPDSGQVIYHGTDITQLPEAKRSELRLREFGFVFQFGQLLPDLTAADNVSLPLLLDHKPRDFAVTQARQQLAVLGLEELADKRPMEMSGGEAQRVAIARALITQPQVLFADEPTGNLDSLNAEQTMEALVRAAEHSNTAVVLVTHDAKMAAYSDRQVTVRDGKIANEGGFGR
ncbi:MAG: ABC transporter ATP-binding protein [Trueperella sp.]|nr:ABC transporter ATP-binding protein [Trueperella sp.]